MYEPEIWKIQDVVDGWLWIVAPTMSGKDSLSFEEVRGLFKDLKILEAKIKDRFKGWIAYTRIENAHILHALRKLGAKPFDIDKERIWFKKEV